MSTGGRGTLPVQRITDISEGQKAVGGRSGVVAVYAMALANLKMRWWIEVQRRTMRAEWELSGCWGWGGGRAVKHPTITYVLALELGMATAIPLMLPFTVMFN